MKLLRTLFFEIYYRLPVFMRRGYMRIVHFIMAHKDSIDFEVHLCDHCNLNCRGCDNFSPVAPVGGVCKG